MKKFKAILSAGIALCIGVSTLTTAFAANSLSYYKIGDFDANKRVDVSDVTTLQMQLAGFDVMEVGALNMTDFNGDRNFDVSDITDSQKMIAGLDYNCFIVADESYKNIDSSYKSRPIVDEKEIEFELLYNERDLILDGYYECYPAGESYLIKSKEEFYSFFNVYSPEFGDEYFKDYALYFFIKDDFYFNGKYNVNSIGVDGNVLRIHSETFEPYAYEQIPACWHIFCKVKQEDVKDITEIAKHTKYINEESPF